MIGNFNNIVVIGSTGRVTNIYVKNLDEFNRLNDLSMYKHKSYLGGTGLTIAMSIKRVSDVNVKLISVIGNDADDIYQKILDSEIYGYIYMNPHQSTGAGTVVTEKSGKQKWLYYNDYAAKELPSLDLTNHIDKNSFAILSPSNPGLFLKGQKELIRLNVSYMYDPGMLLNELSDMNLFEGLNNAKIIVANKKEWDDIRLRTNSEPHVFAENSRIIIKTLAENGVEIFYNKKKFHVDTFKSEIVDPTGAGDNWRAGFIASLLGGKSLKDSAIYANAFASISVEYKSTFEFTFNKNDLEQRVVQISEEV